MITILPYSKKIILVKKEENTIPENLGPVAQPGGAAEETDILSWSRRGS